MIEWLLSCLRKTKPKAVPVGDVPGDRNRFRHGIYGERNGGEVPAFQSLLVREIDSIDQELADVNASIEQTQSHLQNLREYSQELSELRNEVLAAISK